MRLVICNCLFLTSPNFEKECSLLALVTGKVINSWGIIKCFRAAQRG